MVNDILFLLLVVNTILFLLLVVNDTLFLLLVVNDILFLLLVVNDILFVDETDVHGGKWRPKVAGKLYYISLYFVHDF